MPTAGAKLTEDPLVISIHGTKTTLVLTTHSLAGGDFIIRLSTKDLKKIYVERRKARNLTQLMGIIEFIDDQLPTFFHLLYGENYSKL